MLFARKTVVNNNVRYQTLAEHANHVADIMTESCAAAGISNLGRLAGLIHDCAKSYSAWQNYLEYGGAVVFHAPYAAEFIERNLGHLKATCDQLTRQILNIASRAHHGGMHDALTPSGEKDLPSCSAYSQEETLQADKSFFHDVVSQEELESLFLLACEEVDTHLKLAIQIAKEPKLKPTDKETFVNEAMHYMGLTQRLLYAALIDADRLDAAQWEAEETPQTQCLPAWDAMLCNLEKRLSSFSLDGIGRLRADISEQCCAFDAKNGVFRLFVPTGGGKTLSSLRLALTAAKKYRKRRIVYAEPYLTILSQAAAEIRKSIGENADEKNTDSDVLEFHSNVMFDEDENGALREQQYAKLSERLDKPIVLTSTVQLLNALYARRGARRFAALTGSVIIIDEVQSVPTNSTYLFSMAMNYLAKFCGCLVILCTATPPALESIRYPVRMSPSADVVRNTEKLFTAFRRTEIIPFPDRKFTINDVADFVFQKITENESCLTIMNTKAAAKKLFTLVSAAAQDNLNVFYLSTELCPAHRENVLAVIKKSLQDKRVLVISTQVLEAGVDISFKCVVRSIAGLDSIIQAAGRCNRHGEFITGKTYAIDCVDENLSLLKDIDKGKCITKKLISLFKGCDLSSPRIIQRYYEEYFLERGAALDYKLKDENLATTLLGYNSTARSEYGLLHGTAYPGDLLAQSFQTVGREYTPISDDTIGVVTPFENSSQILEKLKSSTGKDRICYIRMIQQFCVNVYQNQLQKLKDAGAVIFDEEADVWVLEKDAYHNIGGIDMNWQESIDKYIL